MSNNSPLSVPWDHCSRVAPLQKSTQAEMAMCGMLGARLLVKKEKDSCDVQSTQSPSRTAVFTLVTRGRIFDVGVKF